MQTITPQNIMAHILQKRRELEELESLNQQMIKQAASTPGIGTKPFSF